VGRGLRSITALAAGALSVRQLTRYADAWTRVGNKIRAAEQISGTAARSLSEINDIANASRGSIEEVADLYARLLRVSGNLGASELEVARATDVVAKAFKAGGAAASEQASGILQLSQALSSGFLQGDELRSLRENAPLVAQAIANEFATTIGGLKALGAEGELTADRVFRALLNSQSEVEAAFAVTTPTIVDSFSILKNGLVELVGAFNDGSSASANLSQEISSIGIFLTENADVARRFGAQLSEAISVISTAFDEFSASITGDEIPEGFVSLGQSISDFAGFTVNTLKTVIAFASAVGAAIGQAMVRAVVAVADGAVAIANAAISGVESILNGIIDGIQSVISGINQVIEAANSISPVPIALVPDLNNIAIDRISGIPSDATSRQGISDAFQNEFDRVKGGLDDLERGAIETFERIRQAGDFSDEEKVFSLPVTSSEASGVSNGVTDENGSGGSRGRGSRGTSQKAQNEALREAQRLFESTRTSSERYASELERLEALKQTGLISDELYQRGLEQIKDKFSDASQGVQGFAGEIGNAIARGEDLGAAFKNIIDRMVSDLISSGLQNLIANIFSGVGGGSGGGGLGSIFAGLFGGSFEGGGFTGTGPRSGGLDGRGGFPALLHPNETVIDHTRAQGIAKGNAVFEFILPEGLTVKQRGEVRGISIKTTQEGIRQNNRLNLPGLVNSVQSDSRRRG
jgi:tape measure domain-containing protein